MVCEVIGQINCFLASKVNCLLYDTVGDDLLRRRMTTVQLQDVADSEAVKKWKPVCRRLGVSDDVIAQAEVAHVTGTSNGPSEAFYTSLASWRDEQGDEATLFKLTTALKDSGFREVVNTLTKSE